MCHVPDDYAKVWVQNRQRARKEHHCFECSRTILVGEPYERTSRFYDSWDDWAHCAHCEVLRRWLQTLCGHVRAGEVIRELLNHLARPSSDDFLRDGLPHDTRFRVLVACRNALHGWRRGNGTGLPVPVLPPVPAELTWRAREAAEEAKREALYRSRYCSQVQTTGSPS